MIRNIAIALCTLLLFAAMAWTTIAAAPSEHMQQQIRTTPVDYAMPYPGILPDSPLYPLKAFRDRVVSFFITDASKQADFDLLQADKRVAAGEYLLQEKNPNKELISETISKGENYFGDAIKNIAVAKNEGQLTNDFLDKLTRAGEKHQQIFLQMAEKTGGQLHQDLLSEVSRVQDFENQVSKLKLE